MLADFGEKDEIERPRRKRQVVDVGYEESEGRMGIRLAVQERQVVRPGFPHAIQGEIACNRLDPPGRDVVREPAGTAADVQGTRYVARFQ